MNLAYIWVSEPASDALVQTIRLCVAHAAVSTLAKLVGDDWPFNDQCMGSDKVGAAASDGECSAH